MATFIDFRNGCGGEVLRRIGVDIGDVTTWGGYTRRVLGMPDRLGLIARARELAMEMSPTQRVVLAAALAAADLHREAVQVDGGDFWWRSRNLDDANAMAVAAVILRRDAEAQPVAAAA